MKCTACSKEIKPVVAIDIDGTLGDYHGHFNEFAGDWLGPEYYVPAHNATYDGRVPHREWFCAVFGVDVTTFRAIKLAYRQGGLKRTMPIFRGAGYLLDQIRKRDAEVWLTTTRPWDRYDRIDPDTREWLRRHDLPYDALIFDEEDKMGALHRQVGDRVALVLDDLREILEQAEPRWPGRAVMISRDSNRAVEWRTKVASLDAAAEVAIAHIQDWRIEHAFDAL